MWMDAADEGVALFFLESRDMRTIYLPLEFTIAAFSTMCWKLSKNEASIDKSRNERWDKGARETGRLS